MSGVLPVALYAMRIPPGDHLLPATPRHAAMIRVTMASVDPTAQPENQDVDNPVARSTLKLIRGPFGEEDDFDLEDDDEDDEDFSDEDDEDEDEELNGGPSEPKKSKKQATVKAVKKDESMEDVDDDDDDGDDGDDGDDDDDEEEDSEDEAKAMEQLKNIMKDMKGKAKAVDDDEDSEEVDSDMEGNADIEEVAICTLDPNQHYQQPLDFVINAGEEVYFTVIGSHAVHLTGNYILPEDDGRASLYDDDDDEDEYDLSPNEDELDGLDALVAGDSESDELDDLPNPRITEVDLENDKDQSSKPKKGSSMPNGNAKSTNKRSGADLSSDAEEDLDELIAKEAEKASAEPTKKLTKAEKKRAKKLKNNEGVAVPAPTSSADTPTALKKDKDTNGAASAEKKVQFAKKLEQGPTAKPSPGTPTTAPAPATSDKKGPSFTTTRTVQGITISDHKPGSGPSASTNSRLQLRYIGKLSSGKVFDSNKKGEPFSVRLGKGEVIKGWDIGLEGIKAGGERRLVIPAKHAYGNKAQPGIPAGSELTFDVKCLSVS